MTTISIQKYQNKVTHSVAMCFLIMLLFNLGCTKKRTYDLQEQLDQNLPLAEILKEHPKERLYGKYYQGGLIYYIYDGQTNYCLIATQKPIATGVPWADSETVLSNGGGGNGFESGMQNTQDILDACSTPGIAPDLCNKLELNGYSDWFLPSARELYQINFLFHHHHDFPFMYNEEDYYWSSSWKKTGSSGSALSLKFIKNAQTNPQSFTSTASVIAVRMITF